MSDWLTRRSSLRLLATASADGNRAVPEYTWWREMRPLAAQIVARRWIQRLVIRGRSRTFGLRSYTLVSLAAAREQAFANRQVAREGCDPLTRRAVWQVEVDVWPCAAHCGQEPLEEQIHRDRDQMNRTGTV